jgi:hypothetical protein
MQQFLKFYYLTFYIQLNMFRASSRPSSELNNCGRSLWFYRWSVVVAMLFVVVGPVVTGPTTTNSTATTTFQR